MINDKLIGLWPHKCHVCGKMFECTKDYVYKILRKGGAYTWFCSYKCMRAFEKEKENGKHWRQSSNS